MIIPLVGISCNLPLVRLIIWTSFGWLQKIKIQKFLAIMEISSSLLSLISCPITGDSLTYDKERKLLINKRANLAYPVVDGVPLLLKSEAIKL